MLEFFFFASYSVTLKVSARNLNQYVSFFSCADNSLNDQLILVMVNICKLLQRSKKYPIQAIGGLSNSKVSNLESKIESQMS